MNAREKTGLDSDLESAQKSRARRELHLLKRRLIVAKAERLDDVAEAQLAFDKLLAETQAIEHLLDAADAADAAEGDNGDDDADAWSSANV